MFLVLLLCLHVISGQRVALVTFHGGNNKNQINNIYKYNFVQTPRQLTYAGKLIAEAFAEEHRELRGLLYDPTEDALYYANAYRLESKLFRCSGVREGNGTCGLISNSKLFHPYGIAGSPGASFVYASNQDSRDVTLHAKDGSHISHATLARVGNPRGLAIDGSANIWVADKTTNALLQLDPSGQQIRQANVPWPIGVVFHNGLIFSTSRSSFPIRVFNLDATLNRTFVAPTVGFKAPAGLVVDDPTDSVYVMTQAPKRIHRFVLSTGQYDTVVAELTDVPQHIIIVPSPTPCDSTEGKHHHNPKLKGSTEDSEEGSTDQDDKNKHKKSGSG